MSVTLDQSEANCIVRLEGQVDISSAPELKDVLLQALALGRELRVELASGPELDITAFQLLWAAERETTASGIGFHLEGQFSEKIAAAVGQADLEKTPVKS